MVLLLVWTGYGCRITGKITRGQFSLRWLGFLGFFNADVLGLHSFERWSSKLCQCQCLGWGWGRAPDKPQPCFDAHTPRRWWSACYGYYRWRSPRWRNGNESEKEMNMNRCSLALVSKLQCWMVIMLALWGLMLMLG
jgi:hypothetical protein